MASMNSSILSDITVGANIEIKSGNVIIKKDDIIIDPPNEEYLSGKENILKRKIDSSSTLNLSNLDIKEDIENKIRKLDESISSSRVSENCGVSSSILTCETSRKSSASYEEELSTFELPFTALQPEKDDLKSDRNMVKRRRSSFGKYLHKSKPQPVDNKDISNVIGMTGTSVGVLDSAPITLVVGEKPEQMENLNVKADLCQTEAISGLLKEDDRNIKAEISSARTKIYKERTQQLKEERLAWKDMQKRMKQELINAKREYEEAKSGQTVIEEDELMPYLSAEQKTFLAAKPNYNQYIQQVQHEKEKCLLFWQEIERTTVIYGSFLNLCKRSTRQYYESAEEKFLGDLRRRTPKDLVKEIIELNVIDDEVANLSD